jgi:predicted transcriptional regulator
VSDMTNKNAKTDEVDFFTVYRKKGFGETLEVLSSFKKSETRQSLFFNTLKENKSYLNSFFRVKDDLLKNKLIAYKLDTDNEKVIFLTEKGKELYARIMEIENLIKNPGEN